MTIRAMSYEEARLDYFKQKAANCRKTLRWWQRQKPGKQCSEQTILDMCADLESLISYLDNVILVYSNQETMGSARLQDAGLV